MKKLIIAIILTGFVTSVSAQYNTELIDTTKIWSIANQPCPGCGGILYSFYIKLKGDTLINNSNYTKIFRAFDEYMDEWELYGFIKEEENKYFLRNLIGEEGLAYDFGINLGDTVAINNPYGFIPLQAIVTLIDSVQILPANQYRKRYTLFEFENFGNEEIWIEGLGSAAGIIVSGWDMTILTGGDDFTLLCYYEEDELMYQTTLYSLCFYPIVDIPDNNFEKVDYSISPNPVTNTSHLIVKNPENKTLNIRIFNSFGQLVEQHNFLTSFDLEIRSEDYSKGVYFFSIFENYKYLTSDKFIIR